MPSAADWERRLGRSPAPGTFDGEEIAGLPEPVQRHLTAAIRSGIALTTAVWVPTALLPRFGVTWSAADHAHITARYTLGETPVDVTYALESDGHIRSLIFDRWGDPDNTGTFAWHPFGGQFTGYRTFAGLTTPSAGSMGWHFGTDRWPEGEFFRFQITHLRPLNPFPDIRARGRPGRMGGWSRPIRSKVTTPGRLDPD